MARDKLFDLAINRALSYSQRLELALEGSSLETALLPWYQQTRFAYRIPLQSICQILLGYPGDEHFWQGGPSGGWQAGKAPKP